jgi:UDP-3-O-[3-hydroxymyristoyl] glucosamine N-acyltransferase
MTFDLVISDLLDSIDESYKLSNTLELNKKVFNVRSLSDSTESSLIWLSPDNENPVSTIKKLDFGVLILSKDLMGNQEIQQFPNLVFVENPKLVFVKLLAKIQRNNVTPVIDESVKLHEDAIVGENVSIGPFSFIGKSKIGSGTIIYPNVTIYDNVDIGENVIINSGTVIGSDGFGFVKDEDGKIFQFPHVGGVRIGDSVIIGSNTSIDKGSLGNTTIGNNTKIDNLVHIAHNVEIGEGCYVIAHTIIGGSTKIKDRAWISPNTTIRDGITIGKGSLLGMGSVLTKDLPDNEIWLGAPAKFSKKNNLT